MRKRLEMARNDWYEAGEEIRNLVQDAVENQDFSQLSETISNVVNQTVDGFQAALKESFGAAEGKRKSFGRKQWFYDSEDGGFREYEKEPQPKPYREAADRIRREMEDRRTQKEPQSPAPKRLKVPGKVTGTLMVWTGYTFGSMIGLSLAILGVIGYSTGIALEMIYGILGVLFAAFFSLGIGGSRKLGLANRFRRYMDILKERTFCSIEELASATGKKKGIVVKDLRRMIQKGFFTEGHLDRKETCLMIGTETYQQYLLAQQEYDRRERDAVLGVHEEAQRNTQASGQRTETEDEASRRQEQAAEISRESRELIEEGKRYIAHIHACNDRIPGEEISSKLDQLELVVTRIFREVEQRPELAPELRRMMSYYLPTTRKLIDAYCQLDEQPIRGQNIQNTKKEIENALDTINQAFENLLDGFFENTAWDISADISVLHTMFAQEGLTGKDFSAGSDGK